MHEIDGKAHQALINRIDSILKNKCAMKDDCKFLITESYEFIESRDQKEKYPRICWYRNWLSHSKLDRSEADRIIQEIARQFEIPENEQNTCDKIAEIFSTKELRIELKSIFLSINRPLLFLDQYSSWKKFIGVFFKNLLNKPPFQFRSPTNADSILR